MTRKRKVRLDLTGEEKRLLLEAMLFFRNKTIERGKPAEDIDRVIRALAK